MVRLYLLAAICWMMVLSVPADAVTVYVPDDYAYINEAIQAVTNGDEVIVRPGTYTEHFDFLGKASTLRSELGPRVTIIDGNRQKSVVTFRSGEGRTSVLEGFTIRNGCSYNSYGGGIHCSDSSPTIVNNIIRGNLGRSPYGYGGGIYVGDDAEPLIKNNIISDNISHTWGGGIYCHSSTWRYCYPVIEGNIIVDNHAASGGGILSREWSASIIESNLIEANQSDFGAGIDCYHCLKLTITNNIIHKNVADHTGGAISFYESHPDVTNNTVVGNTAHDQGGAFYCYRSTPMVTNTILWGNNAPDSPEIYAPGSDQPVVVYCDVQGGWTGTGNIDNDPVFVYAAANDLHLTWLSPCRDAGFNGAASLPQSDCEGDARISDGTVDMGADEFYAHLYVKGDLIPGGNVVVGVIGTPGISPVTLAFGSGIQDPPQVTPFGDLYLTMPALWTKILGGIPASGALLVPGTLPSSWQSGATYPFQALLGPQTSGGMLTNLMILTLD